MKKNYSLFFTFLIFSFFAYSQETLNRYNTSWSNVLSGKVICEPAVTSFGFSIISDARTISTFSNSGTLLWEKDLANWREAKIYSLPEDFYLVVKKNFRTISLLNPSGTEIWSYDFEYPVFCEPVAGRDGRFFIRTLDTIYCFGITGLCKWCVSVPKQNSLQIQQLPDGSLVTFLEETDSGKSKGLRITPFGEIIEEITFSGLITSVNSCSSGILLTFSDGNSGLFALNSNNKAENKWVLQTSGLSPSKQQIDNSIFLVSEDKSSVFYLFPFKNKVDLYKINIHTGQVEYDFIIENLNGFDLKKIKYQNRAVFITDFKYAALYSEEGKNIWNGGLYYSPNRSYFDYAIFTFDNTLILCNNDWSLNGYKLQQKINQTSKKLQRTDYSSFFTDNSDSYSYLKEINNELKSEQRLIELKKGFYGKEEIKYINQLIDACENYSYSSSSKATNFIDEKSFFETSIYDLEKVFRQLSLFSDSQFNSYIARFLKTQTNRTLLFALLNGISENGYDPDLIIINALENLAAKTSYKDDIMLQKICDSVYSICLFMGRPAYNSKGKEIIKNMLSANYNTKTRVYARDSLKKIMELDL